MAQVLHCGEHHRFTMHIGRVNHCLIAHRAAGWGVAKPRPYNPRGLERTLYFKSMSEHKQ